MSSFHQRPRPALREFRVRPGLDLGEAGVCRGDCRDCQVLAYGSRMEQDELLALLEPHLPVLRSVHRAGLGEILAVPVRLRHLHVSALRLLSEDGDWDVSLPELARAALLIPGLSGFDYSVLLSWCLTAEGRHRDRQGRAAAHRMTLAHLRLPPQEGDRAVRRELSRRLLHLYADSEEWQPATLFWAVDFSGLDVERRDVRLAALAAAVAGNAHTSYGAGAPARGGDVRDLLVRIEVTPLPVLEVFVQLVWDHVARNSSCDPEALYDLAGLMVSA